MSAQKLINQISSIISLDDSHIDLLATCLKEYSFSKGDYILQRASVAKEIHFIVSGLVRVYHLAADKEVTSYLACDDGFVSSYSSFIYQTPSFESIQCLEDTRTIAINYSSMQRLYNEIPYWDRVGRVLAEQNFLCMAERVLKLQMIPAKEKYLDFLRNSPTKIVQRTPMIHIASYLGIAPESLSRIRKDIS